MNVKNKTIAITGGAGGLGSAMGRKLAENGANIIILDLPVAQEKGDALAAELTAMGVKAYFVGCDITNEEAWQNAVNLAVEKTGRLDVVINSAGINIRKPVEEMAIDEWMTMMKINTGAIFLSAKYAIPVMRKQGGGEIINISSVCGLVGHMFTTEAYTATKGAVTMFTKSIAARYGKDNIRCNAVAPSTVDTPFIHEQFEKPVTGPVFKAQRLGEVPLGRLATADDVANAVLYLASEEASFINGITLSVDGGTTCD